MVRETWDQWLEPIRLQAHCNRMGFNVQAGAHRLRIGIIGNDQEDCNSPETWTGIGSNQTEACDWDRYGSYCSRAGYPTTTNSAGAKSYHYGHPRWAYVLVR